MNEQLERYSDGHWGFLPTCLSSGCVAIGLWTGHIHVVYIAMMGCGVLQ